MVQQKKRKALEVALKPSGLLKQQANGTQAANLDCSLVFWICRGTCRSGARIGTGRSTIILGLLVFREAVLGAATRSAADPVSVSTSRQTIVSTTLGFDCVWSSSLQSPSWPLCHADCLFSGPLPSCVSSAAIPAICDSCDLRFCDLSFPAAVTKSLRGLISGFCPICRAAQRDIVTTVENTRPVAVDLPRQMPLTRDRRAAKFFSGIRDLKNPPNTFRRIMPFEVVLAKKDTSGHCLEVIKEKQRRTTVIPQWRKRIAAAWDARVTCFRLSAAKAVAYDPRQ